MNARLVATSFLLMTFLFFPVLAKAQQPAGADDIAKLTAAIKDLKDDMVTKDDLAELVTKEKLKDEVDALTDLITAQDAEIQKLKRDYEAYKALAQQQTADQGRILAAISQRDSTGNPVLAIRNNMANSPDFRREMSSAVHRTMRRQGTVTIHNRTASDTTMRINHTEYRIPASSSHEVKVPVGTVTTELTGWEAPKNWTVGAPNYNQVINIRHKPTSRVVVNSPVVVERPVIVNPPVIVEPLPLVPVSPPIIWGW